MQALVQASWVVFDFLSKPPNITTVALMSRVWHPASLLLKNAFKGRKKLTLHKTRCGIVVNTLPCSPNCVLVHCRQHEFVVLDAFSRCCESVCLGLVHSTEDTFSTVSHIAE